MDGQPRKGPQKKLEDAGRYWATGVASNKEAIEDLKALNAPDEVIQELEDATARDAFEVWADNWSYVQMFLRLQTQWRVGANGLVGLDYTAAKWLFEVYQIEDQRDMLEALAVIEGEVLLVMSEERDK